MAYTIAVANQKGGVGKTATAVNLAAAMADLGAEVVLVDCDPQATATAAIGFDQTQPYTSLYDVLHKAIGNRRHPPIISFPGGVVPLSPHLGLVPGHIDMAQLEIELISILRRESVLRDVLAEVQARADVVILDCPPALGWLTINALVAASGVLIPVIPDYVSSLGLAQLMHTIDAVRDLNPDLQLMGALLTKVRPKTVAHQVGQQQLNHFANAHDLSFFFNGVPDTIRVAESAALGQPLVRYDPTNPASRVYRALAHTLLGVSPHAVTP